MSDTDTTEDRAFDALIVSLYRQERDPRDASSLPPLTAEEQAALDALPANRLEKLWADETPRRPALLRGLSAITIPGVPPVLWSIACVAIGFYGTFILIAWNLRPDLLPWSASQDDERPQVAARVEADTPPPAPAEIATITAQHQCVWAEADKALASQPSGTRLNAERRLSLLSGSVELTFDSGAKVKFEGPVEFELQSEARVALAAGKLRARVPKRAIGFTVETPRAEIVDLGTEFTAEVAEHGPAQVQVLVGRVCVRANPADRSRGPAARQIILTSGKSIQIDTSGALVSAPDGPAVFDGAFPSHVEEPVAATPIKAASLKDGYQVLAHYRLTRPADEAAATAVTSIAAEPDAQFDVALQAQGQLDYARRTVRDGTAERIVRFQAAKERALLVGSGLPQLSDYFVLEGTVHPDEVCEAVVLGYGNLDTNGLGISVRLGQWAIEVGGVGVLLSGIPCQPQRWTHVALVAERGTLALVVDGVRSAQTWPVASKPSDGGMSVGGKLSSPRPFIGSVREIRLIRLRQWFRPEILLSASVGRLSGS